VPLLVKGVAERLRDAPRLQESSVRRVADTTAELADGERCVESVSYKPKTSNSSDIPYVPLRVLGCLGAVFAGGRYHKLLHSVNKLLQAWFSTKTVADCSQTVAICCNSSKSLDSVSRRGYGIPVEDKGINAAIVGLELPCRAEERGRSGSAHPPLPWAPACHVHGTG
jgi:hypothetical protein